MPTSAWAPPRSRVPAARLIRVGAAPGPLPAWVGASAAAAMGPGVRGWRRSRANERKLAEALRLVPRWRLGEPTSKPGRRRGAWERVARPECEISRSPTSPPRRRPRGHHLGSSQNPYPDRAPRRSNSAPPGARHRGPGAPRFPSPTERSAAAGTGDANRDFLIYFSHGNLSLWLGLPIHFPLTSCGRSSAEGGSGCARALGGLERVEGLPGPRGKRAQDPPRQRARLRRPGRAEPRAGGGRRTEPAPLPAANFKQRRAT